MLDGIIFGYCAWKVTEGGGRKCILNLGGNECGKRTKERTRRGRERINKCMTEVNEDRSIHSLSQALTPSHSPVS